MGNSDSRTIFREHIQQLVNEDLSSSYEFWNSLFTLDASMQDIFQMVSDEDISRLLADYRPNFFKIIEYCTLNIEQSSSKILSLDQQQIICTSNSVKILTRIIPSTYKLLNYLQFWWESKRLPALVKSVLDLMHTQVYTVTASLSIKKSDGIVLALLWKEGLLLKAPTVEVGDNVWLRRYELLLFIKSCLADIFPELKVSPSANFLVTQNCTLQLVYSLLNTLITFNPNGLWSLPYSSYLNTSNKEKCLKIGLQIICLLNYCTPIQPSNLLISNVKNVIKGINAREDLFLIWNALQGLFNSIMTANNTYLPGSQKSFKLNEEILMILLTFINENEGFIHALISQETCLKIVPWILNVALLTKKKTTTCLCAYLLIKLSEHRKFCVYLNAPLLTCQLDLPLFSGTYADLCIISISKLILNNTLSEFSSLVLYLNFLCNISPFCKEICQLASHSLIKVLQGLSVSYFSEESSHEALTLHLEILASLIQYQYRGSYHMIYWLLQNSNLIYKLEKSSIYKQTPYPEVCHLVVQNLKDLKILPVAQFCEDIKSITLVGILPQPHQIVTRRINFEDEKMLSFVFQMFFLSDNSQVVFE